MGDELFAVDLPGVRFRDNGTAILPLPSALTRPVRCPPRAARSHLLAVGPALPGTLGRSLVHFAAAAPPRAEPTGQEPVDLGCDITYVTCMAKGSSGRVVIVVEPALKHDLYVELTRRDLTLKGWFVEQATRFLEQSRQPVLFDAEGTPTVNLQVADDAAPSDGEDSQ